MTWLATELPPHDKRVSHGGVVVVVGVVVSDEGLKSASVWPQSTRSVSVTPIAKERVAGHLGVKTPGDPATPQPSITHSCESSRAHPGRRCVRTVDVHNQAKNCTCGRSTVFSQFALPLGFPSAPQRESRRLSIHCNCGTSTVLALSGPSPAQVVAQRRARQQHTQDCAVESPVFCTVGHSACLSLSVA